MKFSQRVQRMKESPIRKFHPYAVAAKAAGKKVYHLNIGQPDIVTPPAYFEAVRSFSQPVLEYAPSPGIPEMIEAVRRYYRDSLNVQLEAKDILITTGGSEALQMALNCILDPGDEVMIPEPFYPNYSTFVRNAGGEICPIPTNPEEGYVYAVRERIEPLINEHTRAIILTNPGNPTGVVLSREEMRLMADISKEHGLYLIGDEVYREFIYDGEVAELSSMCQFDDIAENTIIIDSVSKRFSACGARIGAVISRNEALMAHVLKYCQARLSVATLDQVASAALYSVPSDYFNATREEYRRRRDVVVEGLKKIPGVVFTCPHGAFYMMVKLPVDDAEQFQIFLLKEFDDNNETVMFAPGRSFYGTEGCGADEIRIAYVLKEADLVRAIELLGRGIEAYNTRR